MAELVHLALGGTISMRVIDGLAVPDLSAAELARRAGITTTPVDLATVGGPQLTFATLVDLSAAIVAAEARGAGGVIVTLGTDAIEEVGAFLADTGPWRLNVVITGAMEPGAEPDSDAASNLRDAAAVALGPRLPEPVVVFAGRVLLARAAVKVSGVARDAFRSPTVPAWTVSEVRETGVLTGHARTALSLGRPGPAAVEVPVLLSLLAAAPDTPAATGPFAPALVCVASGAGNLTPPVAAIAQAALHAGSVVAIATRAADRRLSPGYGYPGGSGLLAGAGGVLAAGMSAPRLRIFLMVGLSQGLVGERLRDRLIAHLDSL
ncbi:asparaginase domain-containing protein [Conexibacter sp. DBS9H8]|uniref:asparaginase domain-containing protein n=1 Tax=Conexibacter sp. DBS9H8 TaxID=2937801 RepID=UPI00201099E5|nr:asparaginase domain-containing protein [Conexibacter sp. DBS9H8]